MLSRDDVVLSCVTQRSTAPQAAGQSDMIEVAASFGCSTAPAARLSAVVTALRAASVKPQAAKAVYVSAAKNIEPVFQAVKTTCASGQCGPSGAAAAEELQTVIQQLNQSSGSDDGNQANMVSSCRLARVTLTELACASRRNRIMSDSQLRTQEIWRALSHSNALAPPRRPWLDWKTSCSSSTSLPAVVVIRPTWCVSVSALLCLLAAPHSACSLTSYTNNAAFRYMDRRYRYLRSRAESWTPSRVAGGSGAWIRHPAAQPIGWEWQSGKHGESRGPLDLIPHTHLGIQHDLIGIQHDLTETVPRAGCCRGWSHSAAGQSAGGRGGARGDASADRGSLVGDKYVV